MCNTGSTFSCHWAWQLSQKHFRTRSLHLPGNPFFPHFHRFISGDKEGNSLCTIICLLNTSFGAVIEKFPLRIVAMLCLKLPYIFLLVLIPWRMVLNLIQHDSHNLSFLKNSEAHCLHALVAHQSVTSKTCRQTSWTVLWFSEQKHLLFRPFSFLLNVNRASSAKKQVFV